MPHSYSRKSPSAKHLLKDALRKSDLLTPYEDRCCVDKSLNFFECRVDLDVHLVATHDCSTSKASRRRGSLQEGKSLRTSYILLAYYRKSRKAQCVPAQIFRLGHAGVSALDCLDWLFPFSGAKL